MENFHVAGWLGVLAAVFVIALVVSWVVLPWAIIGTKPILREVLAALNENNRLQRQINERLGPPTKPSRDDARRVS